MTLASCTTANKCAVGFAGKKSQTYSAACLAMAVALAADTAKLSTLAQSYLEFLVMCGTAGLNLTLVMNDDPVALTVENDVDPDVDPPT